MRSNTKQMTLGILSLMLSTSGWAMGSRPVNDVNIAVRMLLQKFPTDQSSGIYSCAWPSQCQVKLNVDGGSLLSANLNCVDSSSDDKIAMVLNQIDPSFSMTAQSDSSHIDFEYEGSDSGFDLRESIVVQLNGESVQSISLYDRAKGGSHPHEIKYTCQAATPVIRTPQVSAVLPPFPQFADISK